VVAGYEEMREGEERHGSNVMDAGKGEGDGASRPNAPEPPERLDRAYLTSPPLTTTRSLELRAWAPMTLDRGTELPG
jgi:hypothetical protein